MMEFDFNEEELVEVLDDQNTTNDRSLVVFNDDFNTFEHVIETLVKVCKHGKHQAEQCTHIIHYRGKCTVKEGTYKILKPMREGISEAGIKASIV